MNKKKEKKMKKQKKKNLKLKNEQWTSKKYQESSTDNVLRYKNIKFYNVDQVDYERM